MWLAVKIMTTSPRPKPNRPSPKLVLLTHCNACLGESALSGFWLSIHSGSSDNGSPAGNA